jgi:hypothetical protein
MLSQTDLTSINKKINSIKNKTWMNKYLNVKGLLVALLLTTEYGDGLYPL